MHRATGEYWHRYDALPPEVRDVADRCFGLLLFVPFVLLSRRITASLGDFRYVLSAADRAAVLRYLRYLLFWAVGR